MLFWIAQTNPWYFRRHTETISPRQTKFTTQARSYIYTTLCIFWWEIIPLSLQKWWVFLDSDLLWVYGKGLSVEQSRATARLRGCNFFSLGCVCQSSPSLYTNVLLQHAYKECKSVCVSVHSCVFLQVSLHPARCSSGAQGSLHHSFISPFLTQASPLFTPSLLLLGSVSTNVLNCFVCKGSFCPFLFSCICTFKI